MKNFFFLSLLFILFFGFSFAQEGIKDISLKFCNDGFDKDDMTTKYTAIMEPGTQQELCIHVENKSDEDFILQYSFPKGSFSPGGNQICDTSNDFARFLLDNPNREIFLSGNSSVILKETISTSVDMMGPYYGCLAYQLLKPEVEAMGGVFNLIVRKAINLNLFVGGESSISNKLVLLPVDGDVFSTNRNFNAFYDEDGDFIIKFSVKNTGNTVQNVSLEGKIYNPLGFEKSFEVPQKRLMPGQIYDSSVNVGIMPFYKGIFTVRATLKGEPVFEFDTSAIDEKYKQTIVIKETGSLFVFSWLYIILALIIVGLIVKIVVPKKKKVE